MPSLIEEALAGDIGLRRLIEDAGAVAGRVLATVGTLFNPQMIVISGACGCRLLAQMQTSYGKYTLVKPSDVDGDLPISVVGKFLDNDNCLAAVGLGPTSSTMPGLAAPEHFNACCFCIN